MAAVSAAELPCTRLCATPEVLLFYPFYIYFNVKSVQKVILQSTFTSAARVVVDLSVFDGMLGDIFINQKKVPCALFRFLLSA